MKIPTRRPSWRTRIRWHVAHWAVRLGTRLVAWGTLRQHPLDALPLATGDDLTRWGAPLGIERELDESYRERLLGAYSLVPDNDTWPPKQ